MSKQRNCISAKNSAMRVKRLIQPALAMNALLAGMFRRAELPVPVVAAVAAVAEISPPLGDYYDHEGEDDGLDIGDDGLLDQERDLPSDYDDRHYARMYAENYGVDIEQVL
jgi:hypothetical protein